jgi:hypothetical protein
LRFTKEQDGAKRKGKIAAPIHVINGIADAELDRSSRAPLLP